MKISQSLLKSLFNYKKGEECGLLLKERYVNGLETPPTDAMNLGNWFEYKCTNQLPRSGKEPIPDTLKNGDLSIDYRRMSVQVENYFRIIESYGIQIDHTGYVFNHPTASGIADIVATWNGQRVIIDLKTTAKIDDKWSDYGWGDEKFEYDSPQAQHLTIQAVQYKWLAQNEWGDEDTPFYFFVFSTTDTNAIKIFKVEVDQDRIAKHQEQIESAHKYFNEQFLLKERKELAIADMKRCANCPLKSTCEFAVEVPLIKTIYVS